MQSNSLSVLRINLGNIKKNYNSIKEKVGKNVSVSPVIKANAYGMGVGRVANALIECGCNEFYVATLDEGIELREGIPTARIFVLFGINKGEEYYFLKYHLTPVLNNEYQIDLWLKCSENIKQKLDACLHVDIGMTRLGIPSDDLEKSIKKISDKLIIHYILGHLSNSEDKKNISNKKQLKLFSDIKHKFSKFKYSLSNSGGVFLGKEYHFSQVRPGIALYGTGLENHNGMSPVITLISEVIDIFHNKKPVSVGYGCTYTANVGTIIAAVPVGYADGYPRSLSNLGYCFINNIKVPIVGKVNMDCISLDISALPKNMQKIGQKVDIISDNINISTLASMSGMIEHNILTSFGSRYKVEYV